MVRPLRLVDLFAGAGGLTRGFLNTGRYAVVAAVEKERAAAATYAANFGRDHLHVGSIEDWLALDAGPQADVVVGGPPCQGFSNLGTRDPDDPRNRLWMHYVDTLVATKPLYFVLENVTTFLASPQFGMLSRTTTRGRLRAYRLQAYVLNAADFGAPQARRRAIVVGSRRDLPPPPAPAATVADRAGWRTVRQALLGVPHEVTDTELPTDRFEIDGRELPGAFKTSQLHLTRNFAPVSRRRFAAIPEGGNRRDLPESLQAPCWRAHTSGSGDVMGRLRWDKPAVTIRTEFFKPEKGRYLHPVANRPITHLEAALLQGFPLDHLWCGSKTSIARQIGNAVPVPLAEALARLIVSEIA